MQLNSYTVVIRDLGRPWLGHLRKEVEATDKDDAFKKALLTVDELCRWRWREVSVTRRNPNGN